MWFFSNLAYLEINHSQIWPFKSFLDLATLFLMTTFFHQVQKMGLPNESTILVNVGTSFQDLSIGEREKNLNGKRRRMLF